MMVSFLCFLRFFRRKLSEKAKIWYNQMRRIADAIVTFKTFFR